MRESTLFMQKSGGQFVHPGHSAKVCALFHWGVPVYKVRVTEDPDGTYWAWWENDGGLFRHIWGTRAQLEMCFPYGSKVETERGRGEVCRVSIEDLGKEV